MLDLTGVINRVKQRPAWSRSRLDYRRGKHLRPFAPTRSWAEYNRARRSPVKYAACPNHGRWPQVERLRLSMFMACRDRPTAVGTCLHVSTLANGGRSLRYRCSKSSARQAAEQIIPEDVSKQVLTMLRALLNGEGGHRHPGPVCPVIKFGSGKPAHVQQSSRRRLRQRPLSLGYCRRCADQYSALRAWS